VVHHISPYPYTVQYTSFVAPKGMKNPDLTTTKATIQALGGKVRDDADFKVGFEVAHVRKGSQEISFTPDEELANAIQRSSVGSKRQTAKLTSSTAAPAISSGKVPNPPAKNFKLVKVHVTKQGGLTRRSDR